jgi:hypothetical chaperone protein
MPIDCIGIDFGTTNTCVSVREKDSVRILKIDPESSNPNLIRTLIYLPSRQESFFGKGAIDQYFDRGMEGRFFQSIKKLLPNPDFSGTSVFGVRMGVEALVARFLSELRKRIEVETGPVENVPIRMGRPVRYSLDDAHEELALTRFKKSVEMAGFKNVKFVDEPTAAAASVSAKRKQVENELVLVCDLGGGTSDFTLYRNRKNAEGKLEVQTLAVYGVPVAGDSLDSDFFREKLNLFFGSKIRYTRPFSSNVLTLPSTFVKILPKWHQHAFLKEKSTWNFILELRKEIVDAHQKPVLENLITLVEENLGYKLHQEVERLKIGLSQNEEDTFLFKSYPIEIGFPVLKKNYEAIVDSSLKFIQSAALTAVERGNLKPEDVQILQFTGGTAQVPKIRAELTALFPNAKVIDSEAFTAVAEGLSRTP